MKLFFFNFFLSYCQQKLIQFQKKSYKWNLIKFDSFNNGKIIFSLLTKVIILYVRFTIINVRWPNFYKLFSSFFFGAWAWRTIWIICYRSYLVYWLISAKVLRGEALRDLIRSSFSLKRSLSLDLEDKRSIRVLDIYFFWE